MPLPDRLHAAWRRHQLALRATARESSDAGAAMVITMMIVALVTVITTTLFVVTVGNLTSARAARDASSALDAADAGVSQAMSYLRTEGIKTLNCSVECSTNQWSEANPTSFTLPGNTHQAYSVWIKPSSPFPTNNPGIYTIHSTGRSGDGVRSIEVDVSIGTTGMKVPMAVFARSSFNGGGNASVTDMSILSTGCIFGRSGLLRPGIDANFGIPAAAHSSRYIVSKNNGGCTGSNSIHADGSCDSTFPYDQDSQGGALSPTGACKDTLNYPKFYSSRDLDGNGSVDVHGSYLRDGAALRTLYNIPENPFTDSEIDRLKALAESQGSYFTTTSFTSPDPSEYPHSVIFFDLEGGTVDLKNVTGWGRSGNLPAADSKCVNQSLVIVIEGGHARMNGDLSLAAHLILTSPDGALDKANGGAGFIGSIYADTIDLKGNVDISLDECFMTNLSPALLSSTMVELEYREMDRTE